MGKSDSFIWTGPNWGRASTGPHQYFKAYVSEGGIRVPAFIHYQGFKRQGSISNSFASVKDVMPTVLDMTGIEHPGKIYKGREIAPMEGESMLPFLQGRQASIHPEDYVMGWELFAKRAIRQGDWKIKLEPKPYGTGQWQLYNLATDASEQLNLANVESYERLNPIDAKDAAQCRAAPRSAAQISTRC